MPLSHEHVGSKISAKIKIYIFTRAELLITLCNEIPCTIDRRNYPWPIIAEGKGETRSCGFIPHILLAIFLWGSFLQKSDSRSVVLERKLNQAKSNVSAVVKTN